MTSPAPKKIACPSCGTPTVWSTNNPWRPFCSERCKMIDLGNWASEQYQVPGTAPDPSEIDPDLS